MGKEKEHRRGRRKEEAAEGDKCQRMSREAEGKQIASPHDPHTTYANTLPLAPWLTVRNGRLAILPVRQLHLPSSKGVALHPGLLPPAVEVPDQAGSLHRTGHTRFQGTWGESGWFATLHTCLPLPLLPAAGTPLPHFCCPHIPPHSPPLTCAAGNHSRALPALAALPLPLLPAPPLTSKGSGHSPHLRCLSTFPLHPLPPRALSTLPSTPHLRRRDPLPVDGGVVGGVPSEP